MCSLIDFIDSETFIFSFSFCHGGNMREADYQLELRKKIENRFPGSIVLKNDPDIIQGIPDLTVLYKDKWATLEVKIDEKASHQPNQDYYVHRMNAMSFSRFIFPGNEKEVLNELEQSFNS